MKAVQLIPQPGGGRLEIQDVPKPKVGGQDVLVKIKAAGINRGEIMTRKNLTNGDPRISGIEFAGEIAETGMGVSKFKIGDRVMGQSRNCHSEFAAVDEELLLRVPDHMDWVEAAAVPNVLITVHDAMVTNGRLQAGETVLINAASSGIGVMAIQVAKTLGAGTIIATTRSAAKVDALKTLGADVVVDLSAQKLTEAVAAATDNKGVDLIIDSVGAVDFPDNMACLTLCGRLIGVGRLGGKMSEIDLDLLALKRIQLIGVTFRTRTDAEKIACAQACARDLPEALAAGHIKGVVDRTFPLEEIDAAHAYMESNAHTGKIVLTL